MIVLKRLIRCYYETYGSFEGIEKENFYKDIKLEAGAVNDSVDNYLYSCLGYSNVDISAKDRYTYRKLFVQDNLEELYKVFEVNNVESLIESLKSLDCLGLVTPKTEEMPHVDYVRLLATYFKSGRHNQIETNNGYINFSNLIHQLSLLSSTRSIHAQLKSAMFKNALKLVAPKWKTVQDITPTIQLGCMYIPETISVKDRNKIISNAILDASFNLSRISLDTRLNVIKLVTMNVTQLNEATPLQYLTVLDIAHSLGYTVKALIEYCGIKYISTIEQVKDMNCSVTLYTSDSVVVHSYRSKLFGENIVLDFDKFKELYERELLKTLSFEKDKAYVVTNQKILVEDLFDTTS